MGVNLQKGQRVDLAKHGDSISQLMVGLGWDPAEPETGRKGLLGGLFAKPVQDIDIDASVIMLNESGKLATKDNVVYYGKLRSNCGSVVHSGDNRTGGGDGDDEEIVVDLSKVPANISKLVFVVNIYDCANRHQDFGMVHNAFIRVVDNSNRQELIKYNLTDNYSGKTALITGEIYRHTDGWKFAAIGEGTSDSSLSEIVRRYMV